MTYKRELGLFLGLALLILNQLACEIPVVVSDLNAVDCESRGGNWRQEVDSNGKLEEWCEMPTKQQPITQPPTDTQDNEAGDCFAAPNTYNWSYEDLLSSKGTGGVTCNARFLFKNKSAEPLNLIVYTAWDNNKLNDSGWDSHQVPAGGAWEKRVNRTVYFNGVVTFDRVERLLVIRVGPECAKIVPSMSQMAAWEAQAEILSEMPCP